MRVARRHLGVLAAGFLAGWPVLIWAQAQPATPPIVIRHALVIDSVGQHGRAPIHRDEVQRLIAAGEWRRPAAGQPLKLPDGSIHAWEPLDADEHGSLSHRSLRGGYASAIVESDADRIMILEASGHNMAYVNGEPRAGDPYSSGFVHLPILLRAGENELLFHGGRSGELRARLVPPRADLMISPHDMTLPDLVAGESREVMGAAVVINATTRPPNDPDLRLRVSAIEGDRVVARSEHALDSVPALSVRKVGFTLPAPALLQPGEARFSLELVRRIPSLDEPILLDAQEFSLRVRGEGDSIKRTFVSEIDGSVQYYAHRPAPKLEGEASSPPSAPALILTLHGASVEAIAQADAYASKDWAHIIAPTNRRPFGFDWEDWGRLDALEVLDLAVEEFAIDPARVYLTGHSMGGHGAWHLGVTYPDRFAALGPSAGWASFRTYTGAAGFDDSHPIEAMLHRAAASSDTLALAENLRGIGVYVLHGEADDNVPADQARTMLAALAGFHGDFACHEQPAAGHWWDGDASAGADCVDWPPMMEFFQRHARPGPGALNRVRFATVNPGVSATRDWVTIESQLSPLALSTVDVRIDRAHGRISGSTSNVHRLALDVRGLDPRVSAVELDGRSVAAIAGDLGDRLHLERTSAGWSQGGPLHVDLKGPHRNGPFKEAFRHRALLVHGTAGDDAEDAWAFAKARFDAETFWYRGNGSFEIMADVDFDPAAEPDRNIVLYGNADTNAAWGALLGDSPIQAACSGVTIEGRPAPGADVGTIFIRPRPGSEIACVGAVSGTSVRGCRLTERLPWFVSGVAYPDFLVIGPETLISGTAGIRAAGFFGNDWSINSAHVAWGEEP